ncbi:unnamed protein product, partial [marine sediment metagenome]
EFALFLSVNKKARQKNIYDTKFKIINIFVSGITSLSFSGILAGFGLIGTLETASPSIYDILINGWIIVYILLFILLWIILYGEEN